MRASRLEAVRHARATLAPALAFAALLGSHAGPAAAAASRVPAAWRTPAERSGYRSTPTYDETMAYCRKLAQASPWLKLTDYGESGQGRRLPLLIVSRDRAFTPEAARATGKPILLIQNGIHSGEIEGKDASLELVRDIAVLRTRASLLDHAILLVLPIFSVDAHERRSRYNRINQNGPEEMGWRSTPIGLNLNRDYLKAETPEIRALLSNVFTKWWPHLLVDNHTTDGADYQHDLDYGIQHGPTCPRPVEAWLENAFEGRVVPRTRALGHLTAPYLNFKQGDEPRSGIEFGSSTPRFSTAYPTLHGRPAILVETHMLKPYAVRVRATYDLMQALLEEVNAHPEELLAAVAAAEREAVERGRAAAAASRRVTARTAGTPADPRPRVTLRGKLAAASVPFEFRGKRTRWEKSEITGGLIPRYSDAPWDTIIPWFRTEIDSITTHVPAGYLVPREWSIVADRLAVHGVHFRRLRAPWRDTVELQRIAKWHAETALREGHYPTVVDSVAYDWRPRAFRAGDLWVPLDQPSGLAAVHLLEARAPDGLMYWNAFDTVLMRKEYAEGYVIDPIAHRMLQARPALADSFRALIAHDSTFAHDPATRASWFFDRSPWADPELNVDPVARALRAPPESVLEREGP